MKWMLDTNICIAIIKRQPECVIRKLRGKSTGQVGLSSVALGELTYGAEKSARPSQNLEALHEFLLPLEIAPYDEACAFRYGKLRAQLKKMGRPIGALDTLIAAHALALDVVLVTHNSQEFSHARGLRLEDWLEA
jgi:tRNA(fMet)-specific endonuclease VapC